MQEGMKKTLVGALIAAALAIAGYYGLVDQQTSDKIKATADELLTEKPRENVPPPQNPTPPSQQPVPSPQSPAPASSPQAPASQ